MINLASLHQSVQGAFAVDLMLKQEIWQNHYSYVSIKERQYRSWTLCRPQHGGWFVIVTKTNDKCKEIAIFGPVARRFTDVVGSVEN